MCLGARARFVGMSRLLSLLSLSLATYAHIAFVCPNAIVTERLDPIVTPGALTLDSAVSLSQALLARMFTSSSVHQASANRSAVARHFNLPAARPARSRKIGPRTGILRAWHVSGCI